MITEDMTRELIGRQVVDNHGEKVGKIGQIYLDERSGDPTWATVNTGLFGTKESFVPLQNADVHDRDVALGWRRRQSRTARTWAAPTSA
ncbi:PRC-barrel domain-containing protein [Pseudonocardia tropica]|uniref:PRC-barrel domain-containing protein n=1 Tax=Pseudonocardia tropica TaxID=681289 RepID=A0ABV1JZ09_9PSEU